MKKKVIILLSAMMLIGNLCACGGSTTAEQGSNRNAQSAEKASFLEEDVNITSEMTEEEQIANDAIFMNIYGGDLPKADYTGEAEGIPYLIYLYENEEKTYCEAAILFFNTETDNIINIEYTVTAYDADGNVTSSDYKDKVHNIYNGFPAIEVKGITAGYAEIAKIDVEILNVSEGTAGIVNPSFFEGTFQVIDEKTMTGEVKNTHAEVGAAITLRGLYFKEGEFMGISYEPVDWMEPGQSEAYELELSTLLDSREHDQAFIFAY